MSENTAVATTRGKTLDLTSAKTNKRFVEAFTGNLGKLTTDEQSMFLMAIGERIGVRAELGEIMLYQGKPYITIDGRTRIAHRSGRLAGIQPRPASSLERKQFGAADHEVLWICDVYRIGAPRSFRGWGVVNKNTDKNPVAKQFPRELAKKRAKYDALRMAFPPDEEVAALMDASASYIEEAEQIAATRRASIVTDPDVMPDDAETGEESALEEDTGVDDEPGTGNLEDLLGDDAASAEHKNPMREGH